MRCLIFVIFFSVIPLACCIGSGCDTQPVLYRITGRVVDDTNVPIEGAVVTASSATSEIAVEETVSATTISEGTYVLEVSGPVDILLTATKSTYITIQTKITVQQDSEVNFVLPVRTIEGTVKSSSDSVMRACNNHIFTDFFKPIEGATLQMLYSSLEEETQSDNNGKYAFGGILEGYDVQIVATKDGFQSSTLELSKEVLVDPSTALEGYADITMQTADNS